ncbi:MAG: c-type cytochrome [Candidatus Methylomirabilales bacterium]
MLVPGRIWWRVGVWAYLGIVAGGCVGEVPPVLAQTVRPKQANPVRPPDLAKRLITDLGCPICHELPGLKTTIREEAPNLSFEGEMVRPEWLFAFLKNPTRIRPAIRGRMPDFRLSDREALALTKYLMSLRDGLPEPPAALRYRGKPNAKFVAAAKKMTGKDYFDCFSCHLLKDRKPGGKREDWAPDLNRIRHRFRPDFFLKWLVDPNRYRPGTKMPEFFPDQESGPDDILDGDELKQMAALRDYLMSLGPVKTDPGYKRANVAYPNVRPSEGRKLMVRLNCVGCHRVARMPRGKRVGPSLAHEGSRVRREWLVAFLKNPGVIKPEYALMVGGKGAGPRMPSFGFTSKEVASIADFMERTLVDPQAKDPFVTSPPTTELVRQGEKLFSQKFCNNCHRVKQRPGGIGPDLTHAGRRLQPGWTVNFIQRPSHYLDTRMPNLKVNDGEARALATYILGRKP